MIVLVLGHLTRLKAPRQGRLCVPVRHHPAALKGFCVMKLAERFHGFMPEVPQPL